jgi:light-harvesting complex 1 alpha chain
VFAELAQLAAGSGGRTLDARWRQDCCLHRHIPTELSGKEINMWRYWRVVDPRKAIILTGLLIAFVSTSIHLIQISGDRYNINTWHPDTAKAAKAAQNAPLPPSK